MRDQLAGTIAVLLSDCDDATEGKNDGWPEDGNEDDGGGGGGVLGADDGDVLGPVLRRVGHGKCEAIYQLGKEAAAIVGGGGGGRPDMAQAGGKDPGKLPQALDAAKASMREQLGTANQ